MQGNCGDDRDFARRRCGPQVFACTTSRSCPKSGFERQGRRYLDRLVLAARYQETRVVDKEIIDPVAVGVDIALVSEAT